MITLDTPITIDGGETTPRDYMLSKGIYIHPELAIMHHEKELSLHGGFFEAEDALLNLFHDTIANKNIAYTLIGEDEADNKYI